MGLRYWLLFGAGVFLLVFTSLINRLNNPTWPWLMWVRGHNWGLLFAGGGFALIMIAIAKGHETDSDAKREAKRLLSGGLIAQTQAPTEDIDSLVYRLEPKRKGLGSSMWLFSFEAGPTYTWLVDTKYKTVSAKTKAADLFSSEKLKEILH